MAVPLSRHKAITEKIGRDKTGLRGAIYVHVEYDGRTIRSGDSLTEIIVDVQKPTLA